MNSNAQELMPEIKMVSLESLHKNPKNPRIIKDDKFKKLVQSVIKFPEMLRIRPIVVDSSMMILGGNMRYEACKSAGLSEVSIIRVDNLTEDQKREFIIKDNVPGGEWDWDVLANEWDISELEEWGLDVPAINTDNAIDLNDGEEKNDKEQIETCPKCGFQWVK